MELFLPQSASSPVRLPIPAFINVSPLWNHLSPLPPLLPLHRYLYFWCVRAVYCCMVQPLWQQTPQGRDLRHRGWQPLETLGAYREDTSPGTHAIWVCSSEAPKPFYRLPQEICRPQRQPSDPCRSTANVMTRASFQNNGETVTSTRCGARGRVFVCIWVHTCLKSRSFLFRDHHL